MKAPRFKAPKFQVFSAGKWYAVESLGEASKLVERQTAELDMGSTEWYDLGDTGKNRSISGNVLDAKRRIVARISYNGRIWEVDSKGEQTGWEFDAKGKRLGKEF